MYSSILSAFLAQGAGASLGASGKLSVRYLSVKVLCATLSQQFAGSQLAREESALYVQDAPFHQVRALSVIFQHRLPAATAHTMLQMSSLPQPAQVLYQVA